VSGLLPCDEPLCSQWQCWSAACGAAPPAGDGATLEQAMGCWALTWGEAAAEAPELFPDSLVFTADAYSPHFEWEGLDTLGMHAARAVRDDTASTEWTWKRMWRGEMWWHVVAHDSVRFGMGHDGSEFVGFTAAVRGNALSGTGVPGPATCNPILTSRCAPSGSCARDAGLTTPTAIRSRSSRRSPRAR
jgi:hypothetical protein